MESLLDFAQPAWQIIAVIFFLVPGLTATWMIERLAGPLALRPSERLLRAVGLSVLIYLAASPWLLRIFRRVAAEDFWVWEPILGGACLLLLAPLALGGIWAWAAQGTRFRTLVSRLTHIDPAPTAWDFAFRARRARFVRVQLTDGRLVGGLFSSGSFASLYPQRAGLFIEQVWGLNDAGAFVAPIPGSEGILLLPGTIALVELFKAVEVQDG